MLTDGREQTDTKTGKEAAGKEERERGGNCLEDDTEVEDHARSNETPAAADVVTEEG